MRLSRIIQVIWFFADTLHSLINFTKLIYMIAFWWRRRVNSLYFSSDSFCGSLICLRNRVLSNTSVFLWQFDFIWARKIDVLEIATCLEYSNLETGALEASIFCLNELKPLDTKMTLQRCDLFLDESFYANTCCTNLGLISTVKIKEPVVLHENYRFYERIDANRESLLLRMSLRSKNFIFELN